MEKEKSVMLCHKKADRILDSIAQRCIQQKASEMVLTYPKQLEEAVSERMHIAMQEWMSADRDALRRQSACVSADVSCCGAVGAG